MEEQKAKKKPRQKRALLTAFALLLLAVSLIPLFWPGGHSALWRQVFAKAGLSDFTTAADEFPMSLHVLEVGKADSLLVECRGKFFLVDGGTPDQAENISRYLTRRGVTRLEYIVNTHPDQDHVGGLGSIIQQFQVGRYFTPVLPPELIPHDTAYTDTMQALRQKGMEPEHLKGGDQLRMEDLQIQVLAPLTIGKTTNNNSIVLLLQFGETRFLLMGDAEQEEEEDLLKSGVDLHADVLKVGHHGSKTSSSKAFLKAVQPTYGAVSVADSTHGLPDSEIINRLKQFSALVGRTDVNGTLLYSSDGTKVIYHTER